MKNYNANYQKKRANKDKINREEEYRNKPFYMNPRQPHVLTMSNVARLCHLTLEETRTYYKEGTLVVGKMHNGYPRFFADDVFDFATKLTVEGKLTDNAAILTYQEDLAHHKSLKTTDPEKYAELCARLRKGRESLQKSKRTDPESDDSDDA